MTVDIAVAKSRLSQLVDQAAMGEDVVISREGKPLVRITTLNKLKQRIKLGVMKSKVTIASDFDAPLPAHVLSKFKGR